MTSSTPSKRRNMTDSHSNALQPIIFSSELRILDGIRFKHIDTTKTGRRKIRSEGFNSYSYSVRLDQLVTHERYIDREKDRYFELVTNVDTGQVIHRCDEKLSEHCGHGSDKKRGITNASRATR